MVDRSVWNFYEALGIEDDRSALSEKERHVAAICDLRQEVGSGGFDVYFRYWGGNTADVALIALALTLGDKWTAMLAEAMAQLGASYPLSVDEREDLLTEAVGSILHELDLRFYDLEGSTEADAVLSAYLWGNSQGDNDSMH